MKTWNNVKNNIKTLTEEENKELDLLVEIVSSIVERRNELGLSQRDLAEKSGVKQSAIARLESMKIMPQIDTLNKVLTPLDLKLKVEKKQAVR